VWAATPFLGKPSNFGQNDRANRRLAAIDRFNKMRSTVNFYWETAEFRPVKKNPGYLDLTRVLLIDNRIVDPGN